MPREYQYQQLNPDVLKYLLGEPELRAIFVDCLALLQGLLGDYSSEFLYWTLDEPHWVDTILSESISRIGELGARSATGAGRQVHEAIAENVRSNKATAEALRSECAMRRDRRGRGFLELVPTVDEYLTAVTIQYRASRQSGEVSSTGAARTHTASASA